MGLVILGALAAYFIVLVAVTWLAYRWAARRGLRRGTRWLAASGAFALVYLPLFWDYVPILVAHRYYCEKEAGFWVLQSPEEWNSENPGVIETLVDNNRSPNPATPDWPVEHHSDLHLAHINERFAIAYMNRMSSQYEEELFLRVWRWKYELLDKKTNRAMAWQVDFSTGNGLVGAAPPRRFWNQREHCPDGAELSRSFSELVNQFRGKKK